MQIKKIWDKIKTIRGFAAACISVLLFLLGIFAQPEIVPQSAQADKAFGLYFSIHNRSWLFPMNNVTISCPLIDVQAGGNRSMRGFALQDLSGGRSIGRLGTALYKCPFDAAFNIPEGIKTSTIVIQVDYITLFRKRHYESEPQNWNETSKQWLSGNLMN